MLKFCRLIQFQAIYVCVNFHEDRCIIVEVISKNVINYKSFEKVQKRIVNNFVSIGPIGLKFCVLSTGPSLFETVWSVLPNANFLKWRHIMTSFWRTAVSVTS